MSDLIRICTDRIRVKTYFYLVRKGHVNVNKNEYPFDLEEMPIMCKISDDENIKKYQGYESGNRSILYYYNGNYFKAKGIGIPRGISQPIYKKEKIFTYHLTSDLEMCHRSVVWGFMRKEDLDNEIFGSRISNKLSLSYEVIGYGRYNDVNIISFKDRKDLFKYLKSVDEKTLFDKFYTSSKKIESFCFFSKISSDIRVQELLFTFMFPYVEELLDVDDCMDYLKWLGSSCGLNLRKLHDSNILHGTWIGDRRISFGLSDVHSNSYIGNHIVEEENTKLVDFDLSISSTDDKMKRLEKWCLIHMENPLFYVGSYLGNEAPEMNIALKNPFREELARKFEEGINEGYNYSIYDIEKKLKKDMLDKITKIKQLIWDIFKIPKDLTGNVYFLEHLIASKKIEKREFLNKLLYGF